MASTSDIVSVKFNQDQGLFSCCLKSGLRIYNVEPLVEKTQMTVDMVGSLSQCELLFRSNWVAMVSGGPDPKFPDNEVWFWDDEGREFVFKIKFSSSVKAVRLFRDKVVVALIDYLYVYPFPTMVQKPLVELATMPNKLGLCEISPLASAEKQIVIFPGHRVGSVQILDLKSTDIGVSAAPVWIAAHQNELGCLALNQQGTRIATASIKGTLIRVWDSTSRSLLNEVRRGTDPATIYCLNFSPTSDFLCSSSDKGTVHIFALKDTHLNRRISAEYCNLGGALSNYADSQWALTSFMVPQECPCICAFGPNSSVIAICLNGKFHKCVFTPDGNCSREAFDVFLDVGAEDEDDVYL